jgi:uncharacterized protein YqeY
MHFLHRYLVHSILDQQGPRVCLSKSSVDSISAHQISHLADLMARFKEDMKTAMKAKDKDRAQVIKSFISDVTYSEKGSNQAQSVVALLRKAIAKRKDSEKAFKDGGRDDLALKESQMAEILASYLPQQMTEAALTQVIQDTIKDLALTSPKDLGKLMKELGGKLDESVAQNKQLLN